MRPASRITSCLIACTRYCCVFDFVSHFFQHSIGNATLPLSLSSQRKSGNTMNNFKVDIVASRDLVRTFQRRVRGVVDVPASQLALDVIDGTSDAMDGGLSSSFSSFSGQRDQQQQQPQQQRLNQQTPSSPPRGGQSSSSYQLLCRPKPANGVSAVFPSLHDSLVAAIEQQQQQQSVAPVGGGGLSLFLRDGLYAPAAKTAKGEAAKRVRSAYNNHRSELKTKFYPGKKITTIQQKQIPVILERECNSQLRHVSSTRCYYYDHRTCNSNGVAFGYTGPLNPEDEPCDDCDVTLNGTSNPMEKDEARIFTAAAQVRRAFSPVTLKPKQRKPVPVEERALWTFVTPTEEPAVQSLRRRQYAVTPPRLPTVPTPHEQKRRHVSPVAARLVWQPCFSVE